MYEVEMVKNIHIFALEHLHLFPKVQNNADYTSSIGNGCTYIYFTIVDANEYISTGCTSFGNVSHLPVAARSAAVHLHLSVFKMMSLLRSF